MKRGIGLPVYPGVAIGKPDRIVFHIVPPYSIILLILSRWL